MIFYSFAQFAEGKLPEALPLCFPLPSEVHDWEHVRSLCASAALDPEQMPPGCAKKGLDKGWAK